MEDLVFHCPFENKQNSTLKVKYEYFKIRRKLNESSEFTFYGITKNFIMF